MPKFKFDKIVWNLEDEQGGGAAPAETDSGQEPQYDSSVVDSGDKVTDTPREASDDNSDFDAEFLISEDEIDGDLDIDQEIPPVEPKTAEAQPKEVTEESAQKPEEKQAQQPEVPQTEVGSQPEQPQVPQEPAAAQEPQPSPEELQTQFNDFFNKSVDQLEQHVYQLPEDIQDALDTQPSKVLPRLAAQMHMQIVTAALAQIANAFPGMMRVHSEQQASVDAVEQQFFTTYPELKGHSQDVRRIAQVYRQFNPKASYEQASSEIAAMARVQLRIQPESAQAQQPSPAAVQPPVIPTSARGASVPTAAPAQQESFWSEFVNEE